MSDRLSRFVDNGKNVPFKSAPIDDLNYPKIPGSEEPSLFSLKKQAESLKRQIDRLRFRDESDSLEFKALQTELSELERQIRELEGQSN